MIHNKSSIMRTILIATFFPLLSFSQNFYSSYDSSFVDTFNFTIPVKIGNPVSEPIYLEIFHNSIDILLDTLDYPFYAHQIAATVYYSNTAEPASNIRVVFLISDSTKMTLNPVGFITTDQDGYFSFSYPTKQKLYLSFVRP